MGRLELGAKSWTEIEQVVACSAAGSSTKRVKRRSVDNSPSADVEQKTTRRGRGDTVRKLCVFFDKPRSSAVKPQQKTVRFLHFCEANMAFITKLAKPVRALVPYQRRLRLVLTK